MLPQNTKQKTDTFLRKFPQKDKSRPGITGAVRSGYASLLILLILFFTAGSSFGEVLSPVERHNPLLIFADGQTAKLDVYLQEEEPPVPNIHIDDSLALVAYYHATHGETWLDNSGWLEEEVAFWVGVDQLREVAENPDPEGDPDFEPHWRIRRMIFPRNNMTQPGFLPPELNMMTVMGHWENRSTMLSGPIPPEFFQMEQVFTVRFAGHMMSGAVPWEDAKLAPALRLLELRHGFLSGDLPEVMAKIPIPGADSTDVLQEYWPRLGLILIDNNFFTGSLPELGENGRFDRSQWNDNLLTGPIPDWSQVEDQMRTFQIHNNPLDPGPVPDWLGTTDAIVNNLQHFTFQNTNRTGSVPDWITNFPNLQTLSFGEQVEIPGHFMIGTGETLDDLPDLTQITSLRSLNIIGGGWTGPIPEWFGQIDGLSEIHIEDVSISGDLPANLLSPGGMSSVVIRKTNVTGGIPAQWQLADVLSRIELVDNPNMTVGQIPDFVGEMMASLNHIVLAGVGVSGTIPNSLQALELNSLYLRDNPDLGGELPVWLEGKEIQVLDISRTGIALDEIPFWVIGTQNMTHIGLAGLGINGTLPAAWGQGLSSLSLEKIALNDNNFTGNIPASWGDIIRLDSLNLANNQLSGELSPELGSIGFVNSELIGMESIILSGNPDLTGPLPSGWVNADFIRVFEIDGTDLCISEEDESDFTEMFERIPGFAASYHPPKYHSVKSTGVCEELVNVELTELPNRLALHQNYPNPFNPATTIRYEIPVNAGMVSLQVYNVLGQRVAVLIANEQLAAGQYEADFDAARLASGNYIYRLQVGDQVLSRQMMLIK